MEIRVADVCLDADTVPVAALCRGLVEQAAAEAAAGEPPLAVPVTMLRVASWLAAREGVSANLLDPVTMTPRLAWEVIESPMAHVRPALEANGDLTLVEDGLDWVRVHGTGAARQRQVFVRTGSLEDVAAEAVRLTESRAERD